MIAGERTEETVAISSCVRGYHIYQELWKPRVGEKLACVLESTNIIDRYAVAVVKSQDHVNSIKPKKKNKKKVTNSSQLDIHIAKHRVCARCLFDEVVLLLAKYLDVEDTQPIYSRVD